MGCASSFSRKGEHSSGFDEDKSTNDVAVNARDTDELREIMSAPPKVPLQIGGAVKSFVPGTRTIIFLFGGPGSMKGAPLLCVPRYIFYTTRFPKNEWLSSPPYIKHTPSPRLNHRGHLHGVWLHRHHNRRYCSQLFAKQSRQHGDDSQGNTRFNQGEYIVFRGFNWLKSLLLKYTLEYI
jgi:hypothetical protein